MDMILMALICSLTGFAIGWAVAHTEVSIECERQGSFYVGKKDYVCEEKK